MTSICLACYNGEKYIEAQIASILSEMHNDDELIISDDGSSDSTCSIIESFHDSRITLLHNNGRHGVNGNFENALQHANGEFIFLSDQDDVWLPGKMEVCKEALKKYFCVVHDAYITDGELNVTQNSFFKSFNCKAGFIHNWIRNGYLGCAMAFHREILSTALPIPENLPVWHDIWIGSLCQIKHEVAFIPFKGIKFRRHSSTHSITSKSKFSLRKKISYRLSVLWYLFLRLNLRQ
jgi:glycosyltransferase, family 2